MKKLSMTPVHEAIDKAVHTIGKKSIVKSKTLHQAMGHYLAKSIQVPFDLPPYSKSTVDGYALRSADIEKASLQNPVLLQVVGQSQMGTYNPIEIDENQAVYVPTGGMVPEGADTMVMIEDTDLGKDLVKVFTKVSAGTNLIYKGDDLRMGETGLEAGVYLSPRHIGLLASMGIDKVDVFEKPKIAIISTGDELIELGEANIEGQIFDINTHSLRALCASYGLEVTYTGIVKDEFDALCQTIKEAENHADILLLSGGSSVGEKDMTLDAVMKLDGARKIVHGMAFKPGKPTLIADSNKSIILGLPGHPVSALMVMDTVGRRLLNSIWNVNIEKRHCLKGRLTAPVTPAKGRDTCQMVFVESTESGFMVKPHYGKSGMISWIGHSDGYIFAPYKDGKLEAGSEVTVYLWDNNSTFIQNEWF